MRLAGLPRRAVSPWWRAHCWPWRRRPRARRTRSRTCSRRSASRPRRRATNSGIRQGPYSLPAEEMPPSRTVGPAPDDAADDVPLRMPDTSGNLPNLAAFGGQTLTLRRRRPEGLHEDPLLRHHGRRLRRRRLPARATPTARPRRSPSSFPDWCQSGHRAIGPLSKRWTADRLGRRAAAASSTCPPRSTRARRWSRSQLPPRPRRRARRTVAYLMALTLEQPDGDLRAAGPLGRASRARRGRRARHHARVLARCAERQRRLVRRRRAGDAAAVDEEGGSGVEQVMYRIDGGAVTALRRRVHARRRRPAHARVPRDRLRRQRRGLQVGRPQGRRARAVHAARLSPRPPLGPGGWYDGARRRDAHRAATATGSGSASTEYRLDGGAGPTYERRRSTIDAAGAHVARVPLDGRRRQRRSRPAACTCGSTRTAPGHDALAQRRGAAPPPTPAPSAWRSPAATARAPGAASTEYRLDGGGVDAVHRRVRRRRDAARHRVDFRSRDVVGNIESVPHRRVHDPRAGGVLGRAAAAAGAVRGARAGRAQPRDRRRAARAAGSSCA